MVSEGSLHHNGKGMEEGNCITAVSREKMPALADFLPFPFVTPEPPANRMECGKLPTFRVKSSLPN